MRGGTVSVANKGRSHVTLKRPLQLLYPLEINHSPDPKMGHPDPLNSPRGIELKNVSGETNCSDVSEKPQHLQRASTKERRRTWIAQLEEN